MLAAAGEGIKGLAARGVVWVGVGEVALVLPFCRRRDFFFRGWGARAAFCLAAREGPGVLLRGLVSPG